MKDVNDNLNNQGGKLVGECLWPFYSFFGPLEVNAAEEKREIP